jgi:hypothetical protein
MCDPVHPQHAYDYPDPSIASQGLSAGIRLADIASASCHAIHMKSHLCESSAVAGGNDGSLGRPAAVSKVGGAVGTIPGSLRDM